MKLQIKKLLPGQSVLVNLHRYAIGLLLVSAYFVRSYGRGWDNYTHMHPDERMLMMVTDRISFPDKLYPDFFNYGSLPIYLLKGFVQFLDSQLGLINTITYSPDLLSSGRLLSTIFDLGTIIFVFFLARAIHSKRSNTFAIISSTIYAFMFFPIQNSHFFVVDVYVTFFLTASTFFIVKYLQSKNIKYLILNAIFIGFAISSKFTSILFVPSNLSVIWLVEMIEKGHFNFQKLKSGILACIMWGMVSLVSFIVTMPYAILPPSGILSKFATSDINPSMSFSHKAFGETLSEFRLFFAVESMPSIRFLRDIKEQTRMNSDPYVFPYTLQYAGTLPYLYHLQNIVIWGIGPFISIWILAGLYGFVISNHKTHINIFSSKNLPIYLFFTLSYLLYFLIIGKSAVKFMRYMLPLYPVLAITASFGLQRFLKSHFSPRFKCVLLTTIIILAVTWTLAFMGIYSKPNPRSQATDWIVKSIAPGSVIGVEHWDDRVPIHSSELFQFVDLPIYDRPDNELKWQLMNERLKSLDYMIIASNRLYTPLQKLTDCKVHRDSCYPIASKYYEALLADKLKFKKVAEFTSYPHIGPFEISDDDADESFTVYDHPKVIIFQKK